jgi:non-ribosomal peptide synthetase component F
MAYLLQGLLIEAAARQPRRRASDGCLLTYQELDRLSSQLARALLRLGVAPGDRVGILAPKLASVNTICAYLRAREPGKQEAAHG